MFGIIDLSTYLLGVIFIVLIPGPNSLYVLGVAAQHGIRSAYFGACGIFLGDTILMVLSVVGATSLLRTSPHLFIFFKMIGVIYLAWMGIKLLCAAWHKFKEYTQRNTVQTSKPLVESVIEAGRSSKYFEYILSSLVRLFQVYIRALWFREGSTVDKNKPFTKALLISLLNPKAILFFISFFIQFVSPNYPYPLISFVILGLILQIVSAIYISLLIFSGIRLAAAFARQYWFALSAQAAAGILFIGFAIKLLTANLD